MTLHAIWRSMTFPTSGGHPTMGPLSGWGQDHRLPLPRGHPSGPWCPAGLHPLWPQLPSTMGPALPTRRKAHMVDSGVPSPCYQNTCISNRVSSGRVALGLRSLHKGLGSPEDSSHSNYADSPGTPSPGLALSGRQYGRCPFAPIPDIGGEQLSPLGSPRWPFSVYWSRVTLHIIGLACLYRRLVCL